MSVKSATDLRTRANTIRTSVAGGAVTTSQVGGLLVDMVDSTVFSPTITVNSVGSAAANTAALQAVIDAAHAAYVAGSGATKVAVTGTGTLWLGPSTNGETYWNYHVQVLANEGCIAMRDGVHLVTARGLVLKPTSATLTAIHVVDGTDQTIESVEIDGGWTAAGAGHGIVNVTTADDPLTAVSNLVIRDCYCHDVGSYGLGLQNGVFTNVLIENFRTKNTGADGIDIKQRPGNTNDSKGIVLDSIYIDAPGLRLDTQTGIDVRGICHLSNITVVNVGRSGAQVTGIRFRVYSLDEGGGEGSSLTNFYVRSSGPSLDVYGVDCGADFIQVSNGEVFSCKTGVWCGGNYGSYSNLIAKSSSTQGFIAASTYVHNRIADCTAYSCGIGFNDQGTYTTFDGCDGLTSTTPLQTAGGSTLQTQQLGANYFTDAHSVLVSGTAGRADWSARGTATDVDLYAEPKGAGILKIASASLMIGGSARIVRGTGSPNSAVVGSVGDIFLRTDGGAATTLYVKESGAATNTGWVGK